jgi:hypothetical protein
MVITDTTSAGVEVTRMTGEWTTEALHLVTTLSTAEGEQKTESYLIGEVVYIQDAGGKWTKGPSGDPEAHRLMNPTLAMKQAQETGGLILLPLGTTTIDGVACVRYQVTPQVGDDDVGSLFTQGIATIGLSNGWVYRFEFDRSEEGLHSQGFMFCTDYNTAITIRAPI